MSQDYEKTRPSGVTCNPSTQDVRSGVIVNLSPV